MARTVRTIWAKIGFSSDTTGPAVANARQLRITIKENKTYVTVPNPFIVIWYVHSFE